MALESARVYRFPVRPEALWSVLDDTRRYRSWWPWLTGFDAHGLVNGDEWRCRVHPPLPYELQFAVRLEEVVPTRVVVGRISGDIAGTARLDIAPHGTGCDVRLTTRLIPSSRTLGIVQALAHPIIQRAHDWVLDTGARQFRRRAIEPN